MVELIAKSAAAGLLPRQIGRVSLSEAVFRPITGISPYAGMVAQAAAAVTAAHGVGLPGPNRLVSGKGAEVLWVGRNRWLLIGPEPDPRLTETAALSDQSDAWVSVLISGADAAAVLARLTPLDLRDRGFAIGTSARSELFHMPAIIARTGAVEWRVMCFRSMARTLVKDLSVAAQSVAARAAL
ncbi:sarcosine oxidase subunit gamma family protein [Pseudooceanicola sp.]|uniref:sarcosine oxidase subunit gamma n=1 Tax=Pseudooceanicola sp. TaxID=1914328 RepID=UPI00261BDBF8|nr:sarcosine oxidase subunit gamma family protein [Pseudooceanicola sp.]MDF1853836.1 sarcosine oxidase subunit gamma family protein [Pseudooceanicola sp.]